MSILNRLLKLEPFARKALLKLLPVEVYIALYSHSRSSFLNFLAKSDPEKLLQYNSDPVQQFSLTFRNDTGNAAGFDKDGSLLEFSYATGAGFSVIGTVLDSPHSGNLQKIFFKRGNPWTPLPYSDSGLNSLGLPSKGIDPVIKRIEDFRRTTQPVDFPIGISIMGHPLKEGDEQLQGLKGLLEKSLQIADFIEINESCPNVAHNQDLDSFLNRIEHLLEVKARVNSKVPVFIKLAELGEAESVLPKIDRFGVDGLVLTNTHKNYQAVECTLAAEDKKLFDYYTKNYAGGISGALIKDYTCQQLKKAVNVISDRQLKLKLIHVGGLATQEDFEKSRQVGPDIVVLREWYTGLMKALTTQS